MVNGEIKWPDWETVGLIGRGSFGAVYEIRRDVLGETERAALKVISIPQSSNDIEEMYSDGYDDESITATFKEHLKSIVAEYSLMRKMGDCVNIVKCDDVRYIQHDNGIGWDIFIKMELLMPLTKALPDVIPEEMVIKLAKDMCTALDACKKHGVIHRDIKPQNIFVSESGDYKLGDFGIAKTVERTASGTKIGTYKYMAPEVYNNQPYGSAADIYSLGLVLYWMLNDRRMPFLPSSSQKITAGMEEEARSRRFAGEPLPAPAHGSAVLKSIVLKACAFDPKNRYSSPYDMLQALEGLSKGNTAEPLDLDVRAAIKITTTEALAGCTKTMFLDSVGKVNVKIPKGIKNGTVLRLVGLGRDDPNSPLVGDAYITVQIVAGEKPSGSSNVPSGGNSGTQKSNAEYAGVISRAEARSGCSKTFTFKDGTSKTVQIPSNCQDAQVVNGVTIYVHNPQSNPGDMRKLPEVILDIYANQSTHIARNIFLTFLGWMIFGMATMQIPVMAVGLMVTIVIVVVKGIKKNQIIESAKQELALRKKKNEKK